jgi:hypothetical protein
MKCVLFVLSCCGLFCSITAGQDAPRIEVQAQELVDRVGGWAKVSRPSIIRNMSEAEREILIRYYRNERRKLGTPEEDPFAGFDAPARYKAELLKFGDPEVVAETVSQTFQSDPNRFDTALEKLMDAALPEAIPMLAPALFVNEPFRLTSVGDAGSVIPRSYRYASAIITIMAKSQVFTDDVRDWATNHRKANIEKLLPVVCEWWKENDSAIRARNYRAVRPGRDIRTAEVAAAKDHADRIKALTEILRAAGKDPNDPKNWVNVVLPSVKAPPKDR